MLKAKNLPGMFWGKAVNCAVHLLNRSTSKSTGGKTPYELWTGNTPAVHHLRTFGCVAHVKVTTPNLKKMDDRSRPMIFVGYEPGSAAYRLYDPATKRVHISRDVIFDEQAQWEWHGEQAAGENSDFVIEYVSVEQLEVRMTAQQQAAPTPAASTSSPVVQTPPLDAEEDLDANHDDAPLRFRRVEDMLGSTTPPGQAVRELHEDLLLVDGEEPTTFAQAEQEEVWRRAMLEEITSIEENKTWRLVDPPAGHRPIGLKWVYKLKKDAVGSIVKHKARLVAKGYVQRAGIDFDEVFAPVARLDSIRLLLALAAQEEWIVHHMDVKSAFLNGELEEQVYVVQPPGFVVEGQEHKSPLEHGLYARGRDKQRLLIGVYVDDLIVVGSDNREIEEFKSQMKQEFKMSDLGPLSFYLGIEVHQTQGQITLNQASYASRIVEKAGLKGCNPCAIPMEPRPKLSRESSTPLVDGTAYRSLVGSLRYLVNTRPDLAFSVGYVNRFMERPTEEHLAAVKRIIRYILGTVQFGCCYKKRENKRLIGYSDSDQAGDVDTRKSTTGVMFFLGANLVSWQSQKQKVVALSSCEAENTPPEAADLKVDNQSALAFIKNLVFHDRSKHIQTKFHFIREAWENGDIKPDFVSSEEQLTDILTKALPRERFQVLRAKI
ncbi:hypothetical protein U9M48_002109, partial [Paspalum notatum var. saurae]